MSEYLKHVLEVEKVKKEADELMMKKIEHYEKEIALVREDAQIQILRLDKRIGELAAINAEHQKLNGELREDNKKLAKQVDDYTNQLRKAGVI
jgi:chaperonin cofactor prefoldin